MTYDVAIAGAGVAGAALAAALARSGRRVLLVERDLSEPRLIVGELLQPGGLRALRALGLAAATDGIDAQRIEGFAVVDGSHGRALPYPASEADGIAGDTGGPGGRATGRAFHHGRFVAGLRRAAQAAPGVTVVQAVVTDVVADAGGRVRGLRYRTRDGEHEARAHLTVAADGRLSTLRARLAGALPGASPADGTVAGGARRVSWSVGVLLQDAAPPFPNHGHVLLTRPSPTLCYPIGTGEVRLLVDVPGELPSARDGALAAHLRTVVAPQLPPPLRPRFEDAVAAGRVAAMPNLALAPRPSRRAGAVSIGDALNMRHPLTGGGMTVALNDVHLLTQCLFGVPLAEARAVDARLARFHERRRALAATIDMMAGALYAVLRAEAPELAGLREALLRYWDLGGPAVNGPMTLLAGLAPRPPEVLAHFVAVALLGMGRTVAVPPNRARGAVRAASRLAATAFTTIRPHLARAFAPA